VAADEYHYLKENVALMKQMGLMDITLLYWCQKFFYERHRLSIMITENGYCDNDYLF
jgi:beta-glucosidase/6-phospho-beta-glucosidase/beta-galactosidase